MRLGPTPDGGGYVVRSDPLEWRWGNPPKDGRPWLVATQSWRAPEDGPYGMAIVIWDEKEGALMYTLGGKCSVTSFMAHAEYPIWPPSPPDDWKPAWDGTHPPPGDGPVSRIPPVKPA
jgi:hypothetical protein